MSYLKYVLRRGALAVLSVYVIVTIVLVLGTGAIGNDVQNAVAFAEYTGATPAELEELRRSLESSFGLDQPFHVRVIDWWVDVTTFDWGHSTAFDEPIADVLADRTATTLQYVVPGLLLSMAFGVGVGVYSALAKDGLIDWSVRLASYLLLGIPAFVLAVYLQSLSGAEVPLVGGLVLAVANLDALTIAALTVAAGLLAGQLRFARASALEQTGEAFVKTLRAKGVDRLGLARHVLRNAALPIVSLSTTELLGVLVLNIYVIERVLGIDGLAAVSLRAVGVIEGGSLDPVMADVPLLMWSVMIIVFVGITLSFLQDVFRGYLDPRIGSE